MDKQALAIYSMDDYSPIERNDVLTLAATWVQLTNIKLSEKKATDFFQKKTTSYIIPFMCNA